MFILAGESGMRVDELINLHIADLLFDSNKIQTRHAKGTNGSGKRSRVSLFSSFAQDSVRHYLKSYRPLFNCDSNLLFPSANGTLVSYQVLQKNLKCLSLLRNIDRASRIKSDDTP